MHRDVELSRLRISRRRALTLGGALTLSGVLAACGGPGTDPAPAVPTTAVPSDIEPRLLALLDDAPRCVMAVEETQGPYWFDVDSIRRDIREERPGLQLNLALRVQDVRNCDPDGGAPGVANAVVEIWHCDAGGVYSGYEAASVAANGGTPTAGDASSIVTMSTGRTASTTARSPPPTTARTSGARRSPTATASRSSRRSSPAGTPAAPCTSTSRCTSTAERS